MLADALMPMMRDRLIADVLAVAHTLRVRNTSTVPAMVDRIFSRLDQEFLLNINPMKAESFSLITLNRAGKFRMNFSREVACKIHMGTTYRIVAGCLERFDREEFERTYGAQADRTPFDPQDRADRIFEEGMRHRAVRSYKGRVSYKQQARELGYVVD